MSFRAISGAFLALVAAAGTASAAEAPNPWALLQSGMIIRKSSNRNQIWYGVAVDNRCAPEGPAPVRPYWRLLEKGPDAVQALSKWELGYLGLDRQEISGEGVTVALRAMPSRSIAIRTARTADGQCSSTVEMSIAGQPAKLTDVYVKQKFFGIDYVLLTGVSRKGETVQERINR